VLTQDNLTPTELAGLIARHVVENGDSFKLSQKLNPDFLQKVTVLLKQFNIEFDHVTASFGKFHYTSDRPSVEL